MTTVVLLLFLTFWRPLAHAITGRIKFLFCNKFSITVFFFYSETRFNCRAFLEATGGAADYLCVCVNKHILARKIV